MISDSNRRQAFVPGSLDQNVGPVLAPSQDVSADGLILDPIDRGPDYQTVASYSGVRLVEAPASPLMCRSSPSMRRMPRSTDRRRRRGWRIRP